MSAEAARMSARVTSLGAVRTWLAEVNRQNIQMLPSNNKMSGKLHIIKVVARGQTAMMMVTRPWRMSATAGKRTKCMRGKWDLGWEIVTWHQMMLASSLTESFCQKSWRSEALWDPSALGPGS
jgi:hypothetical protein